jgi:hypothetical protein
LAESITDEVVSDLAKGTVVPPEFDDDHQKAYARACIQEFVGFAASRSIFHDVPMPFQNTLWWKLFHDDRTRTPGTKQYDMWLLRFRVPMRVFEQRPAVRAGGRGEQLRQACSPIRAVAHGRSAVPVSR